MDCERIRPFLDDFAEGELKPPHKQKVEEHLKACPLCRKELASIREVIRLLRESGQVEEPPDFLQQVRQRIERRRRHVLGRLLPRPVPARVLVPVGCVILAAFGIWLAYRQFSPRERMARYPMAEDRKPKLIARTYAREPTAGYPTEEAEKLRELARASKGLGELAPEASNESGIVAHKDFDGDEAASLALADKEGEAYHTRLARRGYEEEALRRLKAPARGAAGAQVSPPIARKAGLAATDAHGAERKLQGKKAESQIERWGAQAGAVYVRQAEERAELAEAGRSVHGRELSPREKDTESLVSANGIALAGADMPRELRSAGQEVERIPGVAEERAKNHFLAAMPARGTTPEVEEGLQNALQLEKAHEELPVNGIEEGVTQPFDEKHGKRGEAAWFARGDSRARMSDTAFQEGQETTEQDQTLSFFNFLPSAGRVNGDVLLTWQEAGGGAIPELVLQVKDRKKALAQIRKIVADLGGTVEPATREESKYVLASGAAYADALLVKLKAEAYESVLGRFGVRARAPVVPATKPESGESIEGTQTTSQRRGPITFIIRLKEVSEQSHPQQSPPK